MSSEKLSLNEASRLTDLEAKIERGVDHWRTVATCLTEIRDARLYRAADKSFDAYLQRRWGMTAAHAYRLIRSNDAAANVAHSATLTQRQAESLSKIPADRQAEALSNAGGPSARLADIEAAVDAIRPPRRRRAGAKRKPRPVVVRSSLGRVTIEPRTADVSLAELLTDALRQVQQRAAA